MPKSEYPENVQDLPDDKYDQWTAVYHSARDSGKSKETAAKKAWGAVQENNQRLTTKKLKRLIQQTIKEELKESPLESRIGQINRFRIENNISMFELLEDILEQLDPEAWSGVVRGIKEKYGYRR